MTTPAPGSTPAPLDALRAALSGRYTIERELGRGGMATVYRARDEKHGRDVALKVLRTELTDLLGRERFLREIAIVAGLNHPHILPLHDSGEAAGHLFYVMPYVEGATLRDRLEREKQLPVDEALAITRQVADALGYAHAQGVVHRDVKPANILLAGGHAWVADFGVARVVAAVAASDRLTEPGLTPGTPLYMSPEQATAERAVDGRSDIYALACVLYEMLTGAPPFTGSTVQGILSQHLLAPAPSVRVVRPTVSPGAEAAIARALAKVPADRYATASVFAEALAGGAAAPRWRRPALVAGAIVAVLAATAILLPAGPALRLHPRDWILVSAFDSPPDEPALGPTVRELVVAELNQSDILRTVPEDQVTAAMRAATLPDTTRLNPTLAREIAFRTSVRVVITGAIGRLGSDAYSIVVHVIDVEDGSNVLSEATSAVDRADALIHAIQQVVRRVRVQLGERQDLVEANRPLMIVRTPSFAAFRRYADGMAVQRRGDYQASNVLLREAVTLDSSFAAAWAVMAMNYVSSRLPDSARWAFSHALSNPTRMTDVELYRLRADAAFNLDHDLETAVRWYDAVLELRPASIGARNNRALYLSALGRHDDAVREFALAATVDPLLKGPRQIQLLNLAAELTVIGRVDSARATARRLTGAPAQYMALMLASATSQWDSAAVLAQRYATGPTTERFVRIPANTLAGAALAAVGRVSDAQRALRAAADRSAGAEARWYRSAELLLADAAELPPDAPPRAVSTDTSAGGELLRGLYAARIGDARTVTLLLQRLQARGPRGRQAVGFGIEYLQARLAARAGRWSDVVELLREPARQGEHDPFSLDRVGTLPIRWLAADAYARVGQRDSAVHLLERVVAPTGIPPAHYCVRGLLESFARRRLALWYAEAGDWNRARAHWRAFTRAWSAADGTWRSLGTDPTGRLDEDDE